LPPDWTLPTVHSMISPDIVAREESVLLGPPPPESGPQADRCALSRLLRGTHCILEGTRCTPRSNGSPVPVQRLPFDPEALDGLRNRSTGSRSRVESRERRYGSTARFALGVDPEPVEGSTELAEVRRYRRAWPLALPAWRSHRS
jgi:hypothetical protein